MDGSISTGKDLAKAKFQSHCRPQRGRKVQPHDQAQAYVAAQDRCALALLLSVSACQPCNLTVIYLLLVGGCLPQAG